MKFLVLNGANLNLLGVRNPEVYGTRTLSEINEQIKAVGEDSGVEVDFVQSNIEGELIDEIHDAIGEYDGIVLNAGAFTHYSYALRDAIEAAKIPTIEVHMTNIYARERFRNKSVIAPVCSGQITGIGEMGYVLALAALTEMLRADDEEE